MSRSGFGGIKSFESHRVSNPYPPPSAASLRPSFPLVDIFNQEEASRKFTCFNLPPSEPRIEIWKQALPRPRVIEFDICVIGKGCIAGYEPPTLLSVCRESWALVQQSWFQCFTTVERPTAIYVHPSRDYILLRERLCLLDGECEECLDNGAFDRYGEIDLIQNLIIWDSAGLPNHEGRVACDDFYQILIKFPALRKVLSCVYCVDGLEYFNHCRHEEEVISTLVSDAHEENSTEPAIISPQILAIRDCELKYMNWIEGDGRFQPWNKYRDAQSSALSNDDEDQSDNAIEDFIAKIGECDEVVTFAQWQCAVGEMLSELSDEEIGACLQDFFRMTDDLRFHHLRRFHLAGLNTEDWTKRSIYAPFTRFRGRAN